LGSVRSVRLNQGMNWARCAEDEKRETLQNLGLKVNLSESGHFRGRSNMGE